MSRGISRREFLRRSCGLGVALGLTSLIPGIEAIAAVEDSEIDLAVVSGAPQPAIKKAIELLGGISLFVKPGDRVLLKPNMSFGNPPNWGSTTDPRVVRAVSLLCLEAGAKKVVIMDHTLRAAEACLKESGIRDAVSDLDKVAVVTANTERFFTEVEVPDGDALKTVAVAKQFIKCESFINLPCAKSHAATGVSLGMKNLMGLIWDRQYFHERTDLNKAIAELAALMKPDLIILDATRALLNGGPGGPGRVKEIGTIVAGTDQVAVDSYGTSLAPWYGQTFSGKQVRHILEAFNLGLGEIDIEKLRVKRVSI